MRKPRSAAAEGMDTGISTDIGIGIGMSTEYGARYGLPQCRPSRGFPVPRSFGLMYRRILMLLPHDRIATAVPCLPSLPNGRNPTQGHPQTYLHSEYSNRPPRRTIAPAGT